MNIIVRTDASQEIGSGHVMRCLAFSDVLRDEGANVTFICRSMKGDLCDAIENAGFKVHRLYCDDSSMESDAEASRELLMQSQDIDCLIVDHYALNNEWETGMRPHVKKIMVIDDLADRNHDSDVLLDQNYYIDMESRYDGLVPDHCRKLVGPQYALLRKEFMDVKAAIKERSGIVGRVMIFFGSSDLSNETSKVLKALKSLNRPDIAVDVVIGKNNAHKSEIMELAHTLPYSKCHCNVSNMAELMGDADVYVGAAGITTWERCCMGLPSLVVTVAENQVQTTKDMAGSKLLYFIGESDDTGMNDILNALQKVIMNPESLKQFSMTSMKLVDGSGAKRCAEAILTC